MNPHEPIAIVGMAGRFPGARDVRALWTNVCKGEESVVFLSEAQLRAAGATSELLSNPSHVPACATAEGLDCLDADFFGVSPRDAELMDPQLRLALETVWEALEHAGVDPTRDGAAVGLFMGAGLSSYLCANLIPNRALIERAGAERVLLLNDKDFYPTTISYRLDLRGPSVSVGTACSSSLVAVHMACQSLLADECRMAIAGAASVHVPFGRGYLHTKEGIYSPDGHCRAFDAGARGTVGADGAAFVVLKRYSDALRDRDCVHALIRGSALNNDGGLKAGYSAPSVDGQSAVIRDALQRAGVRASEIGYVEAHGTGTILGDPVEVAALTEVFQADGAVVHGCALGALKSNIGHLDAAAGAAGLIKATLIVREGLLPPAVNFEAPNPHLDLASSPFFVNTTLGPWVGSARPRRAGVSAFGVGGTNVHVILEEAPATPRHERPGARIVPVSARNTAELDAVVARLGTALTEGPALADVEFTLARGRKHFPARRAVVVATRAELAGRLVTAGEAKAAARPTLAFFAPPTSAAPEQIGRELFAGEQNFRRAVSACLDVLDDAECVVAVLRSFTADAPAEDSPAPTGMRTVRAFAVRYALARMLMEWGARPDPILGLEVGALVADCVSGSLSLADALRLARRADDLDLTARAMVVALSERDLAAIVPTDVAIVAVCAPEVCVVAGPARTLTSLGPILVSSGIACRWLKRPPPRGWEAGRSRRIRIDDAIQRVAHEPTVWIELGSGGLLPGLLRRNGLVDAACLPGLATSRDVSESRRALEWLATLWERGIDVDWARVLDGRDGRRCELPTYPFHSTRFWIDAPALESEREPDRHAAARGEALEKLERAIQHRDGPVRDLPVALRRELDQVVVDVIGRYFSAKGVEDGSSWEFDALADRLGALPKFHQCLRYFLHVLDEEHLASIEAAAAGPRVTLRALARPPAGDRCRELRTRFPEFRGLIDLVEHCAGRVSESMGTEHGGLRTLYPDGSDTLIRTFLDDTVRYGALPLSVEMLCRWVAEDYIPSRARPVRILEVGMGGGILTWNLVPLLRGFPVEYVATDITHAMIADAERRARREPLPWMTCQLYDLRRDPEAQGLRPGSFDLILALDVLHVVPRVADALSRLRRLLAPDGVLGIIESTSSDRWPNLVWGASAEWWTFEDRERTPLMSAARWTSAFHAAGFEKVVSGPSTSTCGDHSDCALFLVEGHARDAASADATPVRRALEAVPRRDDMSGWFYTPVWRPWTTGARERSHARQRWVLFRHDEPGGVLLERRLRDRGHDVVVVRQQASYGRLDADDYRVRAERAEDYAALVQDLLRDGAIDGVLHAWTMRTPETTDRLERLDADQTEGIHSLIFLMQALGRAAVTAPLRLGVVTNNTWEVSGGDLLRPEHAPLQGAAKIVPQEYPNVRCVHIDLDLRTAIDPNAADDVIDVLASDTHERFVARRHERAFRLDVEPATTPASPRDLPFRERGVYLITGGLGGIGLRLAEYLARTARPRLILVSRVGAPPRSEWARFTSDEGRRGDQVRRLLEIEALGAEVLVISADLCDRERMRRLLHEAEARFGPINGVIHTAAVADTAGAIQRRSRRAMERAMAAKVRGTLVLDDLLRDRPLDVFVLCSALGATLYNLKFGEIGYVAGNDFINAYSRYLRSSRGVPAVAIAWTDWAGVGMAAEGLKRFGQARPDAEEVEHAFWERRTSTGSRTRYSGAVHSGAQWMFSGHRLNGCPTVPGTGMIELIASAFCLDAHVAGCEIRQLHLLSPLAVEEWERGELSVTLDTRERGSRCELTLRIPGEPETTHAAGVVDLLSAAARPAPLSIQAIQSRCRQSVRIVPGAVRAGAAGLDLDPRWDSIREVWLGAGEGLARLELPRAFESELQAYHWHPALLDSAVAFLPHAAEAEPGELHLPMGYEQIRLWAPLEPIVYSHGRWAMAADPLGSHVRFDFVVTDADGHVLAEIDGMLARPVSTLLPSRVASSHRLEIGKPGLLTTLGFQRVTAPAPPPGHVEIEVMAAGVSFKSVLKALGQLDEEPTFSLECAGRVTRVGLGVAGVAPGDDVIACGTCWTMPLVCVPAEWLQRKPEAMAFEEAATLPVAFSVAHYGLLHAGRLRAGETVLIHSACGGVGLAAIQIARRAGARIIATAGTETNRAHLRSMGIEWVSDSRTPDFARDVLEWTAGRGVDVVLNALAGELLDKNFDVLAPRGRLVELGRRDLLENRPIGLQRLAQGVQYLPILPDPDEEAFVASWRAVIELAREGVFTPLPYRRFPADRIAEAFDAMLRGEHIGTFVVVPGAVYPPVSRDVRVREAGEMDDMVRSLVQGIKPAEGIEAFRRALATGLPEVLVSSQDLPAMLRQQAIVSERGHAAFWADGLDAPAAAAPRETTAPGGASLSPSPRGRASADVDIDAALAGMWRDLLGTHDIEPDDDFFDVGGDSLVAIRLLARLKEVFDVEQTLAGLFEASTFRQLSDSIRAARAHVPSAHA